MRKKILFSLFILYTIALCAVTLAPGEMVREVNIFKLHDKLLHIASFGIWTGLLYSIYVYESSGNNRLNSIKAIIWGTLFGILIEILQITLPVNRSFEYADIVADLIGSVLAVALLNRLFKTTKSVLF
jgi:VanZ family protein